MTAAVLLVCAYLLGAIPTSYIAGRLARGIDLRQHGSGNLGATNVLRVLGWRLAVPVFVLDVAKGWFPTYVFPGWEGASIEWALAYGAAAITGHVFSVFVRFRGGKGVATSAGVFLALAPVATLVALCVWLLVVVSTRVVSLGSIAAALALAPAVALTLGLGTVFWLALGLAGFVVWAHRTNLRRLVAGVEPKLGEGSPRRGR